MALRCREPTIEGLKAYCEYVREEPLLPRQVEWAQIFLQDGDDVIVAPPGTYKSSLTRKVLEWLIGLDQESGNLWMMNTSDQSQLQVMAIEATLEMYPRYQKVFPAVVSDKDRGWSKTAMFVKRRRIADADPTLFASGYTGNYQGLHPQRIFMDDLTNQLNVAQPVTMREQRALIRGVVYDRLKPIPGRPAQGRKVIMTRWGDNEDADLLSTFKAMGYRIHVYPIKGDYAWGPLLAPDVYDDQKLQDIKEAKESLVIGEEEILVSGGLYQTTFMCKPGGMGAGLIKREWWRWYHELPELKHVIHSWDLATGRGTRYDYTAYTAWGRADNGYYMIDLDRWQDIGSPQTVAEKMQVLYTAPEGRLIPREILVEDVGTSTGTVDYLKGETALPIVPVPPGTRDKKARVQSILGLIHYGKVWLPSQPEWLRKKALEFVAECEKFTGEGDRHDDWVDTMSQGLRFLLKRASSTGEAGGLFTGGQEKRRWPKRFRSHRTFQS